MNTIDTQATKVNPMSGHEQITEALRRKREGEPVWRWFDHKVRGHMEARQLEGSRPFMPPTGAGVLQQRLKKPGSTQRVIYLHVPYCRRICSFCAFIRQPSAGADLQAYFLALQSQIKRWAENPWVQFGRPFRAIYLGGGTPTVLTAEQLAQLVQILRDHYPLADDAEITVEARFDGVDENYLTELAQAGVTRMSFGVQSFDTALRQSLGRLADREQVLGLLDAAVKKRFANLSVDLIYNLPGQTIDSWQCDLLTLCASSATGCSLYSLIPMPGSALVKNMASGSAPPLGDLAHEYELWRAGYQTMLGRQGWRRFSFHHFGDALRETSLYNQARAGGMDVLGMGCGAGGMIGRLSYMNPMKVATYMEDQQKGSDQRIMAFESPALVHDCSPVYALTEADGVSLSMLLDKLPNAQTLIDQLLELELVQVHGDVCLLTAQGCFWAYNLSALLTREINLLVAAERSGQTAMRTNGQVAECKDTPSPRHLPVGEGAETKPRTSLATGGRGLGY